MPDYEQIHIFDDGFKILPFTYESGSSLTIEEVIQNLICLREELQLIINVFRCLRRLNNIEESPKILAATARAYEAWCNESGWD